MEVFLLNKASLDGEQSEKALSVDSVSNSLVRVHPFLLVLFIK